MGLGWAAREAAPASAAAPPKRKFRKFRRDMEGLTARLKATREGVASGQPPPTPGEPPTPPISGERRSRGALCERLRSGAGRIAPPRCTAHRLKSTELGACVCSGVAGRVCAGALTNPTPRPRPRATRIAALCGGFAAELRSGRDETEAKGDAPPLRAPLGPPLGPPLRPPPRA